MKRLRISEFMDKANGKGRDKAKVRTFGPDVFKAYAVHYREAVKAARKGHLYYWEQYAVTEPDKYKVVCHTCKYVDDDYEDFEEAERSRHAHYNETGRCHRVQTEGQRDRTTALCGIYVEPGTCEVIETVIRVEYDWYNPPHVYPGGLGDYMRDGGVQAYMAAFLGYIPPVLTGAEKS